MKKIILVVIGFGIGLSTSVALATNWTEVTRINLGTGSEVKVYSMIDNGNTCYISVFVNSTAISCFGGETIKKTSPFQTYIPTPTIVPVKTIDTSIQSVKIPVTCSMTGGCGASSS